MDEGPNSAAPAPPTTAAPKRSALARASLILGGISLGMFCCTIGLGAAVSLLFGVTAVMLGTIALERVRASEGALTGRRAAWTGIGLGLASFTLSLLAQFLYSSVQQQWNDDVDSALRATFAAVDEAGADAAEERWTPAARPALDGSALEGFAAASRERFGEFLDYKVLSEVPEPSLTGVHTLTLAVAFEFERERITGSVVSEMSPMVGRFIPVVRLRSVTLQPMVGDPLSVGVVVSAPAPEPETVSGDAPTRGEEDGAAGEATP
jgi:hypothetical protein